MSSLFLENLLYDEETYHSPDTIPQAECPLSNEFESSFDDEDTTDESDLDDEETYLESPISPNSGASFDGSNSILHSMDTNIPISGQKTRVSH